MSGDMVTWCLVVVCVGLVVMTAASIAAWWSSQERIVEGSEDFADERASHEDAIADLRDRLASSEASADVWAMQAQQESMRRARAERQLDDAEEDGSWAHMALQEAREEHAANVALALTFYGRALAIAAQSGMQYADQRDELEGIRAENTGLRAERES